MARRLKASRSARGRALRAYARQSGIPEDLASQVLSAVTGFENPVLRLHAINAVLGSMGQLKTERQATMHELRSEEDWTWAEIGQETGVSKERAWQIGKGL